MPNFRLIARLDIKAPNLIKGVHLEGLRKIGDPQQHARAYYAAGADEIIYMDIVASLYNRNSLSDIVRYTAEHVFIPITVGGGMRSLAFLVFLQRGHDVAAALSREIRNAGSGALAVEAVTGLAFLVRHDLSGANVRRSLLLRRALIGAADQRH